MPDFLAHLEAAIDGTVLPARKLANLHNGRPIWVRYHLDRVRAAVTPADIAKRPPTLWRYRELLPLPLDEEPVSLGEGMTPLLHCPRLGKQLGLTHLFVKDESQLPTGSFKSRGMTAAVSLAKSLGVKRVALQTAGNAGGAAAASGVCALASCTLPSSTVRRPSRPAALEPTARPHRDAVPLDIFSRLLIRCPKSLSASGRPLAAFP